MADNVKEDSLNAMLVEIARSHADKATGDITFFSDEEALDFAYSRVECALNARLQHDLATEIFSDRSSNKEGQAVLEQEIQHG